MRRSAVRPSRPDVDSGRVIFRYSNVEPDSLPDGKLSQLGVADCGLLYSDVMTTALGRDPALFRGEIIAPHGAEMRVYQGIFILQQ